jgi:soluble lytic murein transglycosylase-like protein
VKEVDRVRSLRLLFVLAVCCLAAPALATAQVPRSSTSKQNLTNIRTEDVFETPADSGAEARPEASSAPALDEPTPTMRADGSKTVVVEAEAAKRPAVKGIDPRLMAETVTNSVLSSRNGGMWNATLGALSTGNPEIDSIIVEASTLHGVDPRLVYAVMNQESRFKQRAVSYKGASGYMQLMPATARRFGVTDIFDPKQNIHAGTKYLRFLLDLFNNDVELALAGYNAGEYRVIREGYRVPNIRETRDYVRKITASYYGRRARNRVIVAYGPSRLDVKDKEEITREAYSSPDDRGVEGLSNYY